MPRALFTRCQPLSFTSFVCVDRWTGRNLTVRLPLDWLVVATAVVLGAVREEPVNDESDDREDEDEETPEKLVAGRAVGFDDFNPDDDVENQDDEAQDSTASAVLPRGLGLNAGHGGGKGQCSQPELEEVGESWRDHGDVGTLLCLSRAKEGSRWSSLLMKQKQFTDWGQGAREEKRRKRTWRNLHSRLYAAA